MPEQQPSSSAAALVHQHLHTIARLLRDADHIGPEAQTLLADLVDELGATLESTEMPGAEVTRLTECATALAQAVHEKHEPGLLAAAQERLDHAIVAAEAKAPALANLTRRLADMLSNLGI